MNARAHNEVDELATRTLVAAGLSLVLGCDPRSNVADENKTTHHLPSEVMAVIPAGEYLATALLLGPGETCNGEMRRQLDKLVDLGQVWPQTKQKVAGFAIDKQVVSCRDYLECIRQKGCKPDKYESYETLLKNDSSVCRDDEAHVRVDEAEAYCAWRGRQLPTFLQWQVAVRGAAGDGIVDAQCRQRGHAVDCQVVSSFGVLVSASMGSLHDDHEEVTRSLDCFPVMLMGYREGDDEQGRARVVAMGQAQESSGKKKMVLYRSRPEAVIMDENHKSHESLHFRCASNAPGRTP